MKKIFEYLTPSILILLSMVYLGCEKNAVEDITTPYGGAQFKVYNFTFVRSATAPTTGTSTVTFNAYANNVRFATVVSTEGKESPNALTMGNLSPARGYSLAPAGQVVLTALTPATAATNTFGFGPSLEIAKVTADVVTGRNYSFYVNGYFDPVTKKADGFLVEDKLPQPDTGAAYIRLVNPAPNTSTLSLQITRTFKIDGVDVVDTTTPIQGVAYKSASDFVKVPSGIYTLRCTDLASGKVVNRTTATTLLRNRVYTFTVRGDLVGTASYPTLFLDFTENR